MRQSLFLIGMFLCSFVFSQEKPISKSKLGKHYIGFNFSPDYCYRRISQNPTQWKDDKQWIDYKAKLNSTVSPKAALTFGINIGTRITEKFSFESGIYFSSKGYNQTGSLQSLNSNSTKGLTAVYRINYFDLPLEFNYTNGVEDVKFLFGFGLVVNKLARASLKFNEENTSNNSSSNSIKLTEDYNGFNMSPSIGIGFDAQINDQCGFRLKSNFRYGFFSAKKVELKALHYEHLWTLGLNVNFYFNV